MSVLILTATSGRHTCIERSVGLFLDQDYEGQATQLIFNNSHVPQKLDLGAIPTNREVILINSCYYRYQTLGEIYNSILRYISPQYDVLSHLDDDDLFLPSHIREGIEGYRRALGEGKLAYKPSYSYYRGPEGISLTQNTMEPSIFINSGVLLDIGYHNTTSDQHLKWVDYLRDTNNILVDKEGKPTLIYNWGDKYIPTFKTSGDPNNPNNFENYKKFSQEHGDGIIRPVSHKYLTLYYNEIESFKNKINTKETQPI